MRRYWLTPAQCVRGGVLAFVLTAAASVRAEPPPAGQDSLVRARAAWDQGEYDVAEALFRTALEQGGLAPPDVLDAYVKLGSTRAILNKKATALAAFKAAALLDARFVVPPEAGKKAAQIAERARRTEARIGSITLRANAPASLGPGEAAQVDASLDAAHAAVVSRVALSARDALTGKSYTDQADAAEQVHFKLPQTLALPDATLEVRVDALDPHANRLASVSQKVRVQPAAHPARPAPVAGPLVAMNGPTQQSQKDEGSKKGGGFWSTPWPYLIGGAALAAGGAAVYFATRPGDDVNVGAVRVQLGR